MKAKIVTVFILILALVLVVKFLPGPEVQEYPQNLPMEEVDVVFDSSTIEVAINREGGADGVKIMPLEVLEDSRCPANANCIWAGTVRVRAMLSSGLGEGEQIFELGRTITTEAEEITLVSVVPQVEIGQTIAPSDYLFTFEISKR